MLCLNIGMWKGGVCDIATPPTVLFKMKLGLILDDGEQICIWLRRSDPLSFHRGIGLCT